MKIEVDEYEVLYSGTVITHDNKNVIFELKPLKFRLVFKTDTTVKDSPINLNLHKEDSCLDIVLTNYNNPLGQGLVRPINVATLNSKVLLLQLIVHSLNDSGAKIIHYVWLTKEMKEDENKNVQ
ncbi:MAG: hypothetical protein IJL35_06010 [Bacteroidaceae bacterium]|nr:hypothetical protein [Bacteroidaceae bacterium]